MKKTGTSQSSEKVIAVLDILLTNFANGFTNGELSKATGFPPSAITRYLLTLEKTGFAERIHETADRWRASHKIAKRAVAIMNSLDAAQQRIEESKLRISTL